MLLGVAVLSLYVNKTYLKVKPIFEKHRVDSMCRHWIHWHPAIILKMSKKNSIEFGQLWMWPLYKARSALAVANVRNVGRGWSDQVLGPNVGWNPQLLRNVVFLFCYGTLRSSFATERCVPRFFLGWRTEVHWLCFLLRSRLARWPFGFCLKL